MKAADNLLLEALRRKDLVGAARALEGGANANTRLEGTPLLHIVALNGEPNIVRLLLDAGGDVNIKDELGFTALMYLSFVACRDEQFNVMNQLIAAGADVNARHGTTGRNALEMTVPFENKRAAEFLISAGAIASTAWARRWVAELSGKGRSR